LKIQPRAFEKTNKLDISGERWYSLIVKQKFIAVPRQIYVDVTLKRLIPTDIMIYIYLCAKCSHGKPVFLSRESMRKDLGGISLSKLADSLKRLSDNNHLSRTKLNGITSTELLTFVKNKENIYIRGRLQHEDRG
jgi:hypothetical protein